MKIDKFSKKRVLNFQSRDKHDINGDLSDSRFKKIQFKFLTSLKSNGRLTDNLFYFNV